MSGCFCRGEGNRDTFMKSNRHHFIDFSPKQSTTNLNPKPVLNLSISGIIMSN